MKAGLEVDMKAGVEVGYESGSGNYQHNGGTYVEPYAALASFLFSVT